MVKKKHIKRLHKILRKKYIRGNVAFYVLLIFVIALAVALVWPAFQKSSSKKTTVNSCIDFDPPNESDNVKLKSVQYNLIKKYAGIVDSKMGEMEKVGNDKEADIYRLKSTNYYGQAKDDDIVYALRSQKDGYHYFDIYLKNGVPIPDFIKNSKSYGGDGDIVVRIDDNTQFPPQGFNTKDIRGLSISITQPAFLNSSNKVAVNYIRALSGIQEIGVMDTSKGALSLYYHLGTIYLVDGQDAYEYIPTDTEVNFTKGSDNRPNAIQMKVVTFKTVKVNAICWYTPECKPAIYLYPEKKTHVSVQVEPKGYLTFTKPNYSQPGGWQVVANPNGEIETDNQTFPYLYYESKIQNSEIKAPTKGFVVSYRELPKLYDRLLPQLGLSDKEQADFQNYWEKVLPQSPYYFVGIMENKNIETIEPLTILPKPATTIRVRLYFEALTTPREVTEPEIISVKRPMNGFIAVEWGGLVKSKPNESFSCSQ